MVKLSQEELNQREFKGYVKASLENLQEEIKSLKVEVYEIRKNTNWLILKVGGVSSAISIIATILFNILK